MNVPEIGDQIYVPTTIYGFRGKEDFIGGVATIDRVELMDNLPADHPNYCSVGIKGRPGHLYGWSVLAERQEELRAQFGDQAAYPDPDDSPDCNHDEGWIEYQ